MQAGAGLPARPRVLLVDDELKVLEVFGNNLSQLGCSVDTASSGEQALSLLERQAYSLALVDAVMPGIDGLSLVARMHARWPDMRLVVISGKAHNEMVAEAFRLGADDFLCKPIDIEQLRHTIARFTCSADADSSPQSLEQVLQTSEREAVLAALQQTGWNRRATAKLLSISYSTLMRKMRKHGLRDQTD